MRQIVCDHCGEVIRDLEDLWRVTISKADGFPVEDLELCDTCGPIIRSRVLAHAIA